MVTAILREDDAIWSSEASGISTEDRRIDGIAVEVGIWPVAGSVRSKSGVYVLKEISCDISGVVALVGSGVRSRGGRGAATALGVTG